MNILLFIIFGAIAGYIASMIMSSSHGWLEDVILGIVGAFLGGFLFNTFGQPGVSGFNLYSFLVAIVGAVIVIGLGRMFHRGSVRHI